MLKKSIIAVAVLLSLQATSAFAGAASDKRTCLNYLKTFRDAEQMKTTLENKEYYLWYYQYGGSALRTVGWAATAGMVALGQPEFAPVGAAASTLATTIDGWFESESFYVDCLAQAVGEPTDPREYVKKHFGELPEDPSIATGSPSKVRVDDGSMNSNAAASEASQANSGSTQ